MYPLTGRRSLPAPSCMGRTRRFCIGKFGRTACVVCVPGLRSTIFTLKSTISRDPRSPAAPLRVHSSTHSEDITALHFYRDGPVLLSASSDGLVCTSNAEEPDEDEAGVHVGNWGCSIAQAGWLHDSAGRPGIWASSDMETFSVWTSEVFPSPHCPHAAHSSDYPRSSIGCRTSTSDNLPYTDKTSHG